MKKNYAASEAWFDEQDQPLVLKDTYCKVEYEYDSTWHQVVERYFDADGKPIASKIGADEIQITYNEKKQVTRIDYYLGGKLALNNSGYAIAEWKLNEDGNIICEEYYSPKYEPIQNKNGYHMVRRTWLDKKHPTVESYYGINAEAVLCKDGYFRIEWTYNEKGEIESEKRFGLDGNEIKDDNE